MAWPRGCALAEVGWSGDFRPGFRSFEQRLQQPFGGVFKGQRAQNKAWGVERSRESKDQSGFVGCGGGPRRVGDFQLFHINLGEM